MKIVTTVATSGAETAYTSGATEFTSGFFFCSVVCDCHRVCLFNYFYFGDDQHRLTILMFAE
jgi:hypothetical protein